jgi:AraC family transcriptional regulator of arabinose operon
LGWSIHLTTQGHGHYNCIREQLVTGPGDLILLSPDALYDYHRDESCDLWEHQWGYFPQEEHRLRWLQWPEIGPGIYHIHADRKNVVKLQGLFDEVYDTYFDSSELVSALTTNIFEQLLIRCHQLAPKLTFPLMD